MAELAGNWKEENKQSLFVIIQIGKVYVRSSIQRRVDTGATWEDEILKLLNNYYKLTDESLINLFEISDSMVDNASDIHQFTSKINSSLDDEEKLAIIEMLWKIIIADGRIDDYENALVRKLSGLLYIDDFKVGEIKKRLTG